MGKGRGKLVVRVVVITPSWDGPKKETRDVPVDASGEGTIVLRELARPSVLRAAIGHVRGGRFTARASSPPLELVRVVSGRGAPASLAVARWTLSGFVPVTPDDPRAASIARAVEAARRV